MKLTAIQVLVHVRIGEEDFGRTALDDNVEQLGTLQLVERLRGENHGSVVLAPGLQGFGDVLLDARIPKKYPRLVDKESLERGGEVAIGNDFIRAVQNVEQERFKQLRIPAHLLEVEALES